MSTENFQVKSFIFGNSGTYNEMNTRGNYTDVSNEVVAERFALNTEGGKILANVDALSRGDDALVKVSAMCGGRIAVEGNLSEARNVWHATIDAMGLNGSPTSRYTVTGYLAPGSISNGQILPNAELIINNIIRMMPTPTGWQKASNLQTAFSNTSKGMLDIEKSAFLARGEDILHGVVGATYADIDNGAPHLNITASNRGAPLVDHAQNTTQGFLGKLVHSMADASQVGEVLSVAEIGESAAKKLEVDQSTGLLSFLTRAAYMVNGRMMWSNVKNAFNLIDGVNYAVFKEDGSMARAGAYSDPNASTPDAIVAYTVANTFGSIALSEGIAIIEIGFTNDAVVDPVLGVPFQYEIREFDASGHRATHFTADGMDERAAIDSFTRNLVMGLLPQITNNWTRKVAVKVAFTAYKDIYVTVFLDGTSEARVYPAFTSASYAPVIASGGHNQRSVINAATSIANVFAANGVGGAPINLANS